MPIEVTMPQMGESVVEGTVTRWLVKVGDRVQEDQPLCEISTDKVDTEIPSPGAGVIAKLIASEGETLPIGAPLATIEDAGAAAGVRAQPKVTGRRGIQIWIPVVSGLTYEDTRVWVEQLSKTIGSVVPELVSWKWDVRSREGLARLDYTQNVSNKTLVAPYSPRPAPGAPVSAPIAWDELDDVEPAELTIATVPERFARLGDLHAGIDDAVFSLEPLLEWADRDESGG